MKLAWLRKMAAAGLALLLAIAILSACGGETGEGNDMDAGFTNAATNGPDMDPTDGIGGTEGTTDNASDTEQPEGADNSDGTGDAGDVDETGNVPQ